MSDRDMEMLERIRALIGRQSAPCSRPDPVNAAMIRHWCEALGDRNPVYVDEKLAAASVHRRIVPPPGMLQAWVMPGYGVRWDADPITDVRAILDAYGFTSTVATNVEQSYLRPPHLNERITVTRTFTEISDRKTTPLGEGHFMTSRWDYRGDAEVDPIAVVQHRMFKWIPRPKGDARTGKAAAISAAAEHSGKMLPVVMTGDEHAIAYPEHRPARLPPTVSPREIEVGTRLSPLSVPITRSFIIASALATRDFQEIHHDPDIARARGSRDIFTNMMTTTGLISRVVTDSFGPNTVLHSIALRLGAPNYPGDTLVLNGSVMSMRAEGDACQATLDVIGTNGLGKHVTATVNLSLKS